MYLCSIDPSQLYSQHLVVLACDLRDGVMPWHRDYYQARSSAAEQAPNGPFQRQPSVVIGSKPWANGTVFSRDTPLKPRKQKRSDQH